MHKQQTWFTLVELIVVITILAILGTIAFISLQWYSQDSKNTKVSSDLRTLISAIETASTENNDFSIIDLVRDAWTYGSWVTAWTFASGANIWSGTYNVWKINFPFIRQWEADFKDTEWNDYIAALISEDANPDNTFYQIVGQTRNKGGMFDALVKWNYLKIAPSDIDGLVSWTWYASWVTNESIGMPAPWIY